MNYTLLDNGADSFRAAYNCLQKLENLQEGLEHNLKDAVIFLNHGVEILLKLVLKNHSAALMFSDIKAYQKAREEMKKSGKADVFEVDQHLKTVTLEEAVKRVEYLCDIEIPDQLKAAILYINKIRNKLMHYGITLDDAELETLTRRLKACYEESVQFLQAHIEDLEEKIRGSRFEMTAEEYYEYQLESMAEMRYEEDRITALEDAYEDLGEGKW